MKILYIRSMFPKLSETFIMEEVIHLIRAGHDVRVLSHRFQADRIHAKAHTTALFDHIEFAPPSSLRGRHKLTHLPMFLARLVLRPGYRRHYLMNYRAGRPLDLTWLGDVLRRLSLTDIARLVYRSSRIDNLSIAVQQHALLREPFTPEVIHCPFTFHWDIEALARLVAAFPGVPFTITLRAGDLHGDQLALPFWPKKRALLAKAAALVTIARFNRDALIAARNKQAPGAPQSFVGEIADALRIDPADIHIVHSSIDPTLFRPQPDIVKQPDQIACVARLTESKGLDLLVAACALLRDRGVEFRCVIVGDGELRDTLAAQIRRLGLDRRVELRHAATQAGVRDVLAASSLFVLPCVICADGQRDILPNSLKEAMAMELPVVTSDISGIRELVEDGREGLLVPAGSAEAIADRVVALLADARLRARLGAAGREKIEAEFAISGEGPKLERVLAEVIARARAARPSQG